MLDFLKETANRSSLSMRRGYDAVDFADLVRGC
jgi:hypothetical protein